MQIMLQEITAGRLPPQLESHFRNIVVGYCVVDAAQPADTGNVGHGFNVKDQDRIHKNIN